ncbi:DNA-binding transcriptional regulator, MarR family [Sphingopyxis sp. YR583]|uniref:hypothetical protein n=1 Tax=Sphingopyxis sp. YR583 TaxID=1881047 RepID=UPI0008A737FF|nr:hypothetical protein [Sphingopyxis sp. YR583]SEH12539.1 DNA-binding transcriptional regulator, MarR family [Sphingopyxis sp. YR583]
MRGELRKSAGRGFAVSAAGEQCGLSSAANTNETRGAEAGDGDDGAGRLAAVAQAEYASRRRRNGLFRRSLFAEPAWDMLLDLYIQRHHGRPVSIHSLCVAAAVPQTTALRWIGKLETSKMIVRRPCQSDNRVVHVALSEEGLALMEEYLRGQLGRFSATRAPSFS